MVQFSGSTSDCDGVFIGVTGGLVAAPKVDINLGNESTLPPQHQIGCGFASV